MLTALQRVRKTIARIIDPTLNAMSLPRQYLKYGNTRGMRADWTDIIMSDEDLYTGYAFAAIRNRANTVARIALEHVRTDTEKENFQHPYLETISQSPSFSDYQFWHNISTYLDLEGVFYLMAVRNTQENRYGNIQYFKLLNPYHIRRLTVQNEDDGEKVSVYQEWKNGQTRNILPEMIIEIRELNPFKENEPYAMTDAAKESQFTLKTANDYTRHALRNNINAPGIVSTGVQLPREDFENFINRVVNHTKGEPLFGNGPGAIDWTDMHVDVQKAALDVVEEMSRESLFAVSGVSKTIMGIEQSGVTRETSKVQKDLLIENQIIPRIQIILDALNQDYKNNYKKEYDSSRAELVVDNPNASDHDAEMKEVEIKDKQFSTYTKLVNKGYEPKIAAEYVMGNIDLDALGEPTRDPIIDRPEGLINEEQFRGMISEVIREQKKELQALKQLPEAPVKVDNQSDNKGLINQQQGALQNAITNIDMELVADALTRIRSRESLNAVTPFSREADIITKTAKKNYIGDLKLILNSFYTVIMQYEAGRQMRDRVGEFSMPGLFAFDAGIRKYIKSISTKTAESHIDTLSSLVYETARDLAKEGKGLDELINDIKKQYNRQIVETRAKVIARTETNRAFTRAQYEADVQFIRQNKLQGRAFKQWHTRSDNPCPFCQSLESEGLVPFQQAFRDLGDDIRVDGQVLEVGFEDLYAGNAHPNCSCDYTLTIKQDE